MVFKSAMDTRVGQFLDTGARSIALEQRYAAPNYAPLPVVLERGDGCWLWDAAGRRYLDFMSAYSAVSHGHAHPRLVRALVEQAQQLAVASRAYHSTALGPFLAALVDAADLPGRHGRCRPAAAANPSRLQSRPPVAGDTAQADRGGPSDDCGGARQLPWSLDHGRWLLHRARLSRRLRPVCSGLPPLRLRRHRSLAAVIDETTCAVLLEPIQGEAGIIVPPDGYLCRRAPPVRRARRAADP